jgi:midasin
LQTRSSLTSHWNVTSKDLGQSLVDVHGILLPRKSTTTFASFSSLVPTAHTRSAILQLAMGIARGRPILVEGNLGVGKTSFIEEIARRTGNDDIIKIHLGDQTDSKILIGSYVCTEIPGEFRFQPGALTQAVRDGRWVIIEDLDLAPLDVISVLLSLLETNQLFIAGRGEVLVPFDANFIAQQFFFFPFLLTGNQSCSRVSIICNTNTRKFS